MDDPNKFKYLFKQERLEEQELMSEIIKNQNQYKNIFKINLPPTLDLKVKLAKNYFRQLYHCS